jgi:hypothetical protein
MTTLSFSVQQCPLSWTLVRRFASLARMTSRSRCLSGKGGQHAPEVGAGEAPLERRGDRAVALAEGEQGGLERGERGPLVRIEDLALEDAEVELDLVEPGRVERGVDDPDRRPPLAEASSVLGPRWLLPLSTIQNTRRALAYGSCAMTCKRKDEEVVVTKEEKTW